MIPAAGAALAYGTASALGGSGFIAAFVAGMTFRLALRRDPGDLNELSEEVGNVLNGVTFVLFGAILLGPALGELTWQLALYAVLSLTVVRMLPVAIAMLGSRARPPTLGFLGWFGPRGLASIVFAVIVVEESELPHEHLIVLAIYLTVGLSVLAHGLTAAPLADRYARWYERHPREPGPADGERPVRGHASPRPRLACDAALMSEPAHLRVYRFDPGAVFEGGLVGAIERLELGRDTKLLDALFVTQDPASGGLAAVDLASGGAGGTFASMLDFRLDPGRREAITKRTLAEHRGGVPRTLIEAIAATLEAGTAIFAVLHTGVTPTVPTTRSRALTDG